MNKELFINSLSAININLDDKQLNQLERYYELLIEWNEKINLTGITEKNDVYLKHFYDSITLSRIHNLDDNITLCDVGSGAGFPGLVLKIVFPKLNITLLDSLNKRTIFLMHVIKELKLNEITVITDRAELYAKNNREKFDIVTCRAVSKLNVLSEICLPLTKVNGYFIPMKASIDDELHESEKAITILGGKIEEIKTFNLPIENSIRNLIKIKKIKKTDLKYPREFNKIKAKAL